MIHAVCEGARAHTVARTHLLICSMWLCCMFQSIVVSNFDEVVVCDTAFVNVSFSFIRRHFVVNYSHRLSVEQDGFALPFCRFP